MSQNTGEKKNWKEGLTPAQILAQVNQFEFKKPPDDKDFIARIKHVKLISNGRIQCHQYIDVTRVEEEDDGTYTIVVEN